ncbi:hypothetical protein EXN66_Car008201 [Channa argus]|uniref:Uncharacterized protein n=1 Tax=Channa argus TaxID=215402 RepID=A0A6G1PQH0_CHAAH|nr:hypothetical protein EXN66_Car008201 [Channa argus]
MVCPTSIKSPLWSSSRTPAWQLQPQHPSDIFTVSPLNTSKPPQSGLSISKTSNMTCPSDVRIPDPINPCHSQKNPNILSSATIAGLTTTLKTFLSFSLIFFYHTTSLALFSTLSNLPAHIYIIHLHLDICQTLLSKATYK